MVCAGGEGMETACVLGVRGQRLCAILGGIVPVPPAPHGMKPWLEGSVSPPNVSIDKVGLDLASSRSSTCCILSILLREGCHLSTWLFRDAGDKRAVLVSTGNETSFWWSGDTGERPVSGKAQVVSHPCYLALGPVLATLFWYMMQCSSRMCPDAFNAPWPQLMPHLLPC